MHTECAQCVSENTPPPPPPMEKCRLMSFVYCDKKKYEKEKEEKGKCERKRRKEKRTKKVT
jgi:hypothetical protein